MRLVLFFVLFGAIVGDLSLEWDKFKRDYNKKYATTAEETERRQIFIQNVNRMRSYQQAHPHATFTMGINHLADRRIEELVSGPKVDFEHRPRLLKSSIEVKNLPESLDWRTRDVVSPVHQQGQVGEIVNAIVSTELVETLYAIETKNLIKGSIAQVFDCCPRSMDVFECIKNMSGICRNSDYPEILNNCEPNKCKSFATFEKINKLPEGDESTMLTWLQDSTLWAEMHGTTESFTFYTGGIYDDPDCPQYIDHAVQVIGYGSEEGKPYWLCKNSWGETWGEKGYFRIVRGKNMCGIASIVLQVANTKKISGATQLYTNGAITLMFLLAIMISRSMAV